MASFDDIIVEVKTVFEKQSADLVEASLKRSAKLWGAALKELHGQNAMGQTSFERMNLGVKRLEVGLESLQTTQQASYGITGKKNAQTTLLVNKIKEQIGLTQALSQEQLQEAGTLDNITKKTDRLISSIDRQIKTEQKSVTTYANVNKQKLKNVDLVLKKKQHIYDQTLKQIELERRLGLSLIHI